MIHGKWYADSKNLSVLDRKITHEDEIFLIDSNGKKAGMCSLTTYKDSLKVIGDKETSHFVLLKLNQTALAKNVCKTAWE